MFYFPNNALFHYCKLDTAARYILPSMELRISSIKNTNDPRENKGLIFGSYASSSFTSLSTNELLEINNIVSHTIREGCKVLCLSYSDILKGYQLSHMWAHYGDNHKGICIAIDSGKFAAENKKYFDCGYFNKVKYVSPDVLQKTNISERYCQVDLDRFRTAQDDYLKNDFRVNNIDYLYFTKGIEWEHEQEARLIYFGDEAKEEFCTINKSLTRIFLGVDFEMKNLPMLKSVVGDNGCEIWQLEFSGEWISCARRC